jgi:hypothetical protein
MGSFIGAWLDLPRHIRVLIALVILGASAAAAWRGVFWPWGCTPRAK